MAADGEEAAGAAEPASPAGPEPAGVVVEAGPATDPEAARAEAEASERACVVRSGLFEAGWYLATYADVAAAGHEPLSHFLRFGWREGRRPNPYFDPRYYLACNADVRRAGGNPLLHYIGFGEAEGRRPVLYFDPAWYRAHHRLAPAESPLAHFLAHRQSGKVSPVAEFDAAWYQASYSDVAAAGGDPFWHYLAAGFREGRNPSATFNTRFYARRYLANRPEENPLLHYLAHRGEPGVYPDVPAHETTIAREVARFTRPGPAFEEVRPLPASAPPRARVLAYYLPQFHAIPENDAWWGKGFTEWTNLARGLPRFAGHYQPRAPRDLGPYSLADPEVMRRQIALARGGGIGGFVFYFYWFNGRRLLESPLDAFLADRSLDMPFSLMWANESWTRRWDGSAEEVLISQDYREEDEAGLVATFARHFRDPRYLRIGGRPVLMVYRPGVIPEPAAMLARWRTLWRDGWGEAPLLVMAQSFTETDPRPLGFDGAIEFPPHKLIAGLTPINPTLDYLDFDFTSEVYDYEAMVAASLAAPEPPFPLIRTVIPGWDNDPRRQGRGLMVHRASPARYQAWLERLVVRARAQPFFGEAIVCVNAWNEWAEGAYLEPDLHFGAAFLNATGRAAAGLADGASLGRLLLVGHDAFAAGAQTLLLRLARHYRRVAGMDIRILLLGRSGREADSLEEAYGAVAPVAVVSDPRSLAEQLVALHGEGFRNALVNSAAAARACPVLAGVGIVPTLLVHEMPRMLADRGLIEPAREAVRLARVTVFPAALVQERFVAATGEEPANALVRPQGCYRPAGFDAAARAGLRARLGVAEGATLVLGIGHADLRKGFDLFLALWRRLRERDVGAHAAWVGALDPATAATFADEIAAAEAAGTFHLPGRVEDVGAWYSAADALALTSREDPFPSVVLEAVSAGLGVVAFSGTGGAPEFLLAHGLGETVPLGDAGAMAAAVAAQAQARTEPAEIARRAALITRDFDFPDYASRLMALAIPGLARISVVVASHDHARHLPRRLAGVFAQTHPLADLTLFDDASTDESVAVARAVAAEWGRDLAVRVTARNSGGPLAAWRAAAEARGEFLWIAEGDDDSEPAFLARLATALAAAPRAAFAFCDSRVVDAEGATIASSYRPYCAEVAPGLMAASFRAEGAQFLRRGLAERNLILNLSGVLWRRAAFAEALARCGDELAGYLLAADWRLYVEALAAPGAEVVYLAEALNRHRRHRASVTAGLDRARHLAEIASVHAVIAARLGADPDLAERQRGYRAALARQFATEAGAVAAGEDVVAGEDAE